MAPIAEESPLTAPTTPAQPLGPDSLTWRLGFPRTALLLAPRALLMQVAHPVIAPAVHDFSPLKTDPWGRLDHTVTSLLTQIFGGQQAVAEAARLREFHKSIKGTGFHGERYSALHPEAYAFVHMANFDSGLLFFQLFGRRPLTDAEQEQLFAEWRQAGLVLGIRDQHMPTDLQGLHAYLDDMIATRLDDNPTVRAVLDAYSMRDIPPPKGWIPEPVWAALKPFGRPVAHTLTVGTLPPALRDKLDLDWSAKDEQRLRRIIAAVRTASPLVPNRLLHYPMAYKAMRASRRRALLRSLGLNPTGSQRRLPVAAFAALATVRRDKA